MTMRLPIYTVAVPILAAVAFAQEAPPAPPKQPAASTAPSKGGSDRAQEVKTQTYSGTLMDAACAGSGSAAAGGCAVAASTTQFALKTKEGTIVRFDDVGNARAQEGMKTHKKWSDSASASKAIHVKANGVLNGDKLTVLSID